MSAVARSAQKDKTTRRPGAHSAHAAFVASQCRAIFEATHHVNGLTKTVAETLDPIAIAAVDGAFAADGRFSKSALESLPSTRQPAMSASARRLALQALRIPPGEDNWYRWFPQGDKSRRGEPETALRIASILHIALALNSSRRRIAAVRGVVDDVSSLEVVVSRAAADGPDMAAALAATALWNAVMPRPIAAVTAGDSVRQWQGISRGTTYADALCAIARREMERFMSRAYGLECPGDIEYVHEMRVALRRLREALRAARGKGCEAVEAFFTDSKRFADALGAVRDIDVFTAFLERYRGRAAEADRTFIGRLIHAQKTRRAAQYRRLVAVFSGPEYRRFVDRYYPMLTGTGEAGLIDRKSPLAGQSVARRAPKMLRKRLKAALRFHARLAKYGDDEKHRLRILMKRLRYAAEFFAPLYPGGLARVATPATRMQDLLGEFHDAVVYRGIAERYYSRMDPRARNAAAGRALSRLVAYLRRRQKQDNEKAASVWKKFTTKKNIRKLESLLMAKAKG